MNVTASQGIRIAGGVLVRWDWANGFGAWRTPDGTTSVDDRTVTDLAARGEGCFVAWRAAAPYAFKPTQSLPVVFRLNQGPAPLVEYRIEVNAAGWKPRGNILATHAAEAIRFAQLAGIVFAHPPIVRACRR